MIWSEKFKINEDLCENGKITYKNLFSLMLDTSNEQSKSINATVEDLLKDGYTWMIHNWFVEFIRLPEESEEVTGETWASEFKRINAYREFNVKDSSGNVIVKASSVFLVIDMNSKMPIRIPEKMAEDYEPENHKNFDKIERIKIQGDLLNRSVYKIKDEDIDENEHVNNTVYIKWFTDSIRENEKFRNSEIKSVNIVYKQEIRDVSEVIVENYIKDGEIYSVVKTSKDEEHENATAKIILK